MTGPHHIFRWDLDKTYLATDFDSLSSLVKIAFEKAEEKVNVPGAASLLRHLSDREEGGVHVHFISGSPQQMESVLAQKLKLDGIRYDSLNLKPNLENITRGRFRAIKEQVGYKLPLLLEGRAPYGPGQTETLFGDDAESDGFIYALYGELMAQRVEWEVVEAVFEECRVYPDTLRRARAARDHLIFDDCVEQIFINLDRRSSPTRFASLSPRIVPVYNYWQAALVLMARGRLSPAGALDVAHSLLSDSESSVARLRNSAEDLLRRRLLTIPALEEATSAMEGAEAAFDPERLFKALRRAIGRPPPPDPEVQASASADPRDWVALFREEKAARKVAKEEAVKRRRG